MESRFRERLAAASIRCHVNLLLNLLAVSIFGAGCAYALLVLCEHLFSVSILDWRVGAGLGGAAAAFVLVGWLVKRPSRMDVALLLDERLGVKERFSTTLAFAGSDDPFAAAARREACEKVAEADVARAVPVRLSRRWAPAAGVWALVAVVSWLPYWDLLGVEEAARQTRLHRREMQQAEADVQRTAERVEAMVEQLDVADLSEDLEQIGKIEPGEKPSEVRRQAIRKLGDVADRLKQISEGDRGETVRELLRRMKELRTPDAGLARELARALARGKFGKASDLARDLAGKLARKDMTAEQQEALEKALKELSEQLQRLAQRQGKNAPESLQAKSSKGLEGADLANCTPTQLQQMLAQGLAGCCSGGDGEGLSLEGMEGLAGQLDSLEAMTQQMALARAALDEIERGQAILGQGLGPGALGMYRPLKNGPPGRGASPYGHSHSPADAPPDPSAKRTGVRAGKPDPEAPIVATWYAYEEQVKGEAKRTSAPAVGAAKDRAAEAIGDNLIPTKYHGAVKDYFDSLGRPEGE